jgi:hypothetical protein
VEFSEVWREARERSWRTAPRRAAVRAAFEATRTTPGTKRLSSEEIRAVLTTELQAREISDCSETTVATMVQAIETSRPQVVAELVFGGVHKAAAAWRLLGEHRMPGWLNPPPEAEFLPADEVDHVMTTQVLLQPTDPLLLRRLVADIRPSSAATTGDAESLGVFLCWLELDPVTPGAVVVHAGVAVLGRLPNGAAGQVAEQLSALVKQGHFQTVEAELSGDTVETADVTPFVPVSRRPSG